MRRFPLLLLIVAGAACGIVAVGFHKLVETMGWLLIGAALQQDTPLRYALVIVVPAVASFLIALAVRRVAPFAPGANLARVRRAYEEDVAVLDDRSIAATLVVTPISLGAGAPLGPEGPTVVIASGAAMWIARIARAPKRVVRSMIPVGTAAGIAAIFNTPITGVVFAMEEVMGTASRDLLGGTIVAAVAAAVVERLMLGGKPILPVSPASWSDLRELIGFAAAGVVAGITGGVAIRTIWRLRRVIAGLVPRAPIRAALGGTIVGAIGVFIPRVLGVGYETTSLFLHGGAKLSETTVAFGGKIAAFVAALSCGMIGGTFAPSLFIGAALGGSIGHAAALVLPHAHVDPGAYALIGMGAFFAAFLRCPVSAVLIVFETTGDYGLVLPVMLAVAIATSLSRRITPHSLTELQMHEEGFREPVEANDPLAGLTAAEVMASGIITVRADFSMLDAARRISGSRHRAYPVINEDGKLLGVLPSTAVDEAARSGTMEEPIAAHVQPNPIVANASDDMLDLIRQMAHAAVDRCPVIDDAGRVVGFISPADILRRRFSAARGDG
ncbi:MAG: chloride channel protein family [Thermoanaerobaculia bacterium]|jgi:CIC family chloride channel protein|nr:chloride channel protein family [Thermoanaerobaculia bacterium]